MRFPTCSLRSQGYGTRLTPGDSPVHGIHPSSSAFARLVFASSLDPGVRQPPVPSSPPAAHLRAEFSPPVRLSHDSRSLPVLFPAFASLRYQAHPRRFNCPRRSPVLFGLPTTRVRFLSCPVRCSSGYGSRLTPDDLPSPDVHQSFLRRPRVSCPPDPCRCPFLSGARQATVPLRTTEIYHIVFCLHCDSHHPSP